MEYGLSGAVILFMLAAVYTGVALASHHVAASSSDCKYYFIIYGQDWCPHCQNMESFVIDNYGPQCLEFRDLDVPAWNENFTLIIQDLNQRYNIPVQPAFPLTGILVNGKLRVIVQGEVTNTEAIDYMVQSADEQGKEWIAVYIGDNGYAITPDTIILKAYTPQKQTGSGSSGVNRLLIIGGVALIIAGLAGVAYLAWRK